MPTVLCILLIFTSMYMKNQIYVLIPNVLNLMHSRPLQGHSYSLILRKDKKSPPPRPGENILLSRGISATDTVTSGRKIRW